MKTLVNLLLAALVVCQAVAQGTSIYRIDMSRSNEPYHATAVLMDSGWEFWAFGSTRSELLDLEVGRLFPVNKNLLLGGYAIYWPDTGKSFVAPALSYSQPIFGGKLSVFAAMYVPLNGGPRILLADDISWTKQIRGFSYGLAANYWQFDHDPATLRLGPTAKVLVGDTTLKISYQSLYLVGHGRPTVRLELSQRF